MEYALEMIAKGYLECKKMVQAMEAELSQLPRGNLTYRTVKGHRYCYLQFREKQGCVKNKIVSAQEIPVVQQQLQRRAFLKESISIYQSYINWIEEKYPQFRLLKKIDVPKDSQKIYCTVKGERVRSKSEVIIANLLYANQIPYEYEKPLKLTGYPHPILPDFTIYIPKEDKTVYWEHGGLMNDPEYRSKWDWKMHLYAEDGITVWQKNLIVTYESQPGDLNIGEIRQHIADLC